MQCWFLDVTLGRWPLTSDVDCHVSTSERFPFFTHLSLSLIISPSQLLQLQTPQHNHPRRTPHSGNGFIYHHQNWPGFRPQSLSPCASAPSFWSKSWNSSKPSTPRSRGFCGDAEASTLSTRRGFVAQCEGGAGRTDKIMDFMWRIMQCMSLIFLFWIVFCGVLWMWQILKYFFNILIHFFFYAGFFKLST